MPNVVTKADLPVVKGKRLPSGAYIEPIRPLLFCRSCGESFSADPGDYWELSPGHVFACGDCTDDEGANVPMVLVRKREVFVPWEADSELTDFLEATWND